MKNKFLIIRLIALPLFLVSCIENKVEQKNITNSNYNKLKSTYELKQSGEVRFHLDSISAPKVEFSQFLRDKSGKKILSIFNKHEKSIYFYDYTLQSLINKIKIGTNLLGDQQLDPTGYYIDNQETIYVYNKRNIELLKINKHGEVLEKTSLIANNNIRQTPWFLKYPQYYLQGSNPIMKVQGMLILPGQFFDTLPDSLIQQFHFITYLDPKSKEVQFHHRYPRSIYGNNVNWSGEKFTEAYIDWNPEIQKLIFSFPVSHELFTTNLKDSLYTPVNGASNYSSSISSLPTGPKEMKVKGLVSHILQTDQYGAIRYDQYRKIYYRFIRHGIKNYTSSSQWNDKEVSVIILDKNFNYLGETKIGTMKNWYLQNVFVNEKGLHIEYLPNKLNEDFLIYKIFNLNKKQ